MVLRNVSRGGHNMTVLSFLVLAVVSIPLGLMAISYFHGRHHHRSHDTMMWRG